MKKFKILLAAFLVVILCQAQQQSSTNPPAKLTKKWTYLLDESFSNFDKFLGVPHTSISSKDLSDEYPRGNGMVGTPIGLNKDPLNVFTVVKENNENLLYITGQMYGGLSTKEEYGDYHLSMQFKWGQKVYEPRLTKPKDSGILYHCFPTHGTFWNVWMNSIEFQVCEKEIGDLFALSKRRLLVNSEQDVDKVWKYNPKAAAVEFGGGVPAGDKGRGRCKRLSTDEKPVGEWSTLELYCLGDVGIHVLNGKVVNVVKENTIAEKENNENFLRKGKIQLQSEGAECWYKDIKIKALTKLPKEIADQL
jgi:Domain of Unknown Function (DUF1080)